MISTYIRSTGCFYLQILVWSRLVEFYAALEEVRCRNFWYSSLFAFYHLSRKYEDILECNFPLKRLTQRVMWNSFLIYEKQESQMAAFHELVDSHQDISNQKNELPSLFQELHHFRVFHWELSHSKEKSLQLIKVIMEIAKSMGSNIL